MNVRTTCPESLDEWEWKSRGGDNVHLPPEDDQPHPTDPLKTLCGVVGTETDAVDADATCPACLAIAQGRGQDRAQDSRETAEKGDREVNEPAALRTSPHGEPDRRPRVEVEIGRPGGAKTRATAMVATGSEASFVRTEVADRLGLRRRAGRKWRIRGDAGTTRIEIAEACIAWCARQALHRSRRKPRR